MIGWWKRWRERRRLARLPERPGHCDVPGCKEHGMIWLNGHEIICWEHYCQRMHDIRANWDAMGPMMKGEK